MLGTDDNAGRGLRHREIQMGISLARILIRDRTDILIWTAASPLPTPPHAGKCVV
jgi:hypothetical protein